MKLTSTRILRSLFWFLAVVAVLLGSAYFQNYSHKVRVHEHRVEIRGGVGDLVPIEGVGEFQVRDIKPFMQVDEVQTREIFVQLEIAQKVTIEGTGREVYALVDQRGRVFHSLGHTGYCGLSVSYILTDCRPIFEVPKDSLEGLELGIQISRGPAKFNFVEPHIGIPLGIDAQGAERLIEDAKGEVVIPPAFDEGMKM